MSRPAVASASKQAVSPRTRRRLLGRSGALQPAHRFPLRGRPRARRRLSRRPPVRHDRWSFTIRPAGPQGGPRAPLRRRLTGRGAASRRRPYPRQGSDPKVLTRSVPNFRNWSNSTLLRQLASSRSSAGPTWYLDHAAATTTERRAGSERWPRHQAASLFDQDSMRVRRFSGRSLRASAPSVLFLTACASAALHDRVRRVREVHVTSVAPGNTVAYPCPGCQRTRNGSLSIGG